MLSKIISNTPFLWGKNDQLIIFGYVENEKKGFVVPIEKRYRSWKRGFRLTTSRAKSVLKHYGLGVRNIEHVGCEDIPNQSGRYHFVYCETDYCGTIAAAFNLEDSLQVGSFGEVRNDFIRMEFIRRGRLVISVDSVVSQVA